MKVGRTVSARIPKREIKKGPSFLFTGAIGATAPKPLFYLKKNAPRFFSLAGRRPAKVGRATRAIRLRTARRSGQDRLVFGLEQEARPQRLGRAARMRFSTHPHMPRHACVYKLVNDGHLPEHCTQDIQPSAHSAGPRGCASAPIRTCHGMSACTNSSMTATYPSTALRTSSRLRANARRPHFCSRSFAASMNNCGRWVGSQRAESAWYLALNRRSQASMRRATLAATSCSSRRCRWRRAGVAPTHADPKPSASARRSNVLKPPLSPPDILKPYNPKKIGTRSRPRRAPCGVCSFSN
jgi:hypothetical protein